MNNRELKRKAMMKVNSPENRLKVPSGLIAKAVHDKLKTPILYYYHIKSFKASGKFKRSEIMDYLIEKTGKSKATIHANISKLLEKGWIVKTPKGLRLISYDKVWTSLGYDVNAEHLGLMFISPKDFYEEMIMKNEVMRCFSRQEKAIQKRVVCELCDIEPTEFNSLTSSKRKNLKRNALKGYDPAKAVEKELNLLRAFETENIDSDTSITCLKFANLFGRTTASTGYRMQQKLKKAGLITTERRIEKLGRTDLETLRNSYLNSSYYFFKGNAYKVMPNRITIL